MRTKRSLVSLLLCFALLFTSIAAIGAVQTAAADTAKKTTSSTDYGLMSTVQSSTILQAWDWSYKNVEANLEKIAEQGFTTVQVSPASVLNGTSAGSTFEEAWKVYQPGVLMMNGGSGMPDNNVLGKKSEFTSMCTKAHQYGIKIIVDTVLNHVGGDSFNDSSTNPLNHLTADGYYVKNYQDELYNRSCFHDYHILDGTHGDWDNDWDMTQYAVLKLPDLNTSNATVQTAAYNYLKELVDAGADGFRFDAAKHIETPKDRSEIKSDFWPNTIKKLQNNYSGKEIYAYGEILGVGSRSYSWYKPYMDITDSGTSDSIRGAIINKTTNGATPWLPSGVGSVDEVVLWDESHDNFEGYFNNGNNNATPVGQIGKIWALEAGRAGTTSVYLARPGNDSGYKSVTLGSAIQTGWANDTTKAVNQFHNHFNGQTEYTSAEGSIAYIERGSTGAVLVNTGDSYGSVSVTKHTLDDGTYKDAITNNTFTVSNGKISGSIGNTGVAVIYKNGESPVEPAVEIEVKSGYNTVVFTNNKDWGTPNIHYWGGTGATTWPGAPMSYCGKNDMGQKQYVAYVPTTCTNVIINDGYNQSADGTNLVTDHTGLYLKDTMVSGNYELGKFDISGMLPTQPTTQPTTSPTQPTTQPTQENVVYLKPNANWKIDNARFAAYFFGTSGNTWVGMTADTVSGLYKCTVPSGTYENVIFCRMDPATTTNDWNSKWNQTNDLTLTGNIGKGYVVADGTWDKGGGEWKTYAELGGVVYYNYTVVYTYTDSDNNQKTITKTVSNSTLTDADQIAVLNDPSSKLVDPKYSYSIGTATKDGTTIDVTLNRTEREYTVSVNGVSQGKYKFLKQATVSSMQPTGFLLDGKLVYYGSSFKVWVTGDLNFTTDSSATHEDVTTISQLGSTMTDSRISLELLASANVEGFKRMGVAFATSAKTEAQIKAAVQEVNKMDSTSGTYNKIAVHKSAVDSPNSSGMYQFRYAPNMAISKVSTISKLYFYTYAETDNGFVLSGYECVDLSTIIA